APPAWAQFSPHGSSSGNKIANPGVARGMNRTNLPSYPNPAVQSGESSYILHLTVAIAAFVTCCWPYLIWHGIDQSGGWVWDTSSWTACLLWWLGVSLLLGVIAVLNKAR